MTEEAKFSAIPMESYGVDTLVPYVSRDTAITIAEAKSRIEEREYGVIEIEGHQWYSIGIAREGVFHPYEKKELIDGLGADI